MLLKHVYASKAWLQSTKRGYSKIKLSAFKDVISFKINWISGDKNKIQDLITWTDICDKPQKLVSLES